ncbi:septum site-determining protein MinC [Merismopedia glauca]|uniref:Probable septum site-determining protein MinC n=1 Tax=Merismopedia glauca CCAP 1448/3 TaxID=1296344 RepID=A0A2T1CA64_9CYAN|nr:septum site-determining protein MinC [Merismopedia glauca]PSB05037.1 septum site-determining protein MinC [Merismopedia glauca CCAP 1448/3]
MSSDSPPSDLTSTLPTESGEQTSKIQICLKAQAGAIQIILPKEAETPVTTGWIDLWEQLQVRLQGGDRFWSPQAPVHLVAQDRLLDSRQLKEIADAVQSVELNLQKVITHRRQTAIAAASAGYSVEQTTNRPTLLPDNGEKLPQVLADPLYLQLTVRSGVEISHPGTAIVLGDVNPGGSVVAAGDILVWGRLRGIAHAGAKGNSNCRIMALEMQPTQLRIAGYVARAPQKQLTYYVPEVAYVTTEGIRISKASEFLRNQL